MLLFSGSRQKKEMLKRVYSFQHDTITAVSTLLNIYCVLLRFPFLRNNVEYSAECRSIDPTKSFWNHPFIRKVELALPNSILNLRTNAI